MPSPDAVNNDHGGTLERVVDVPLSIVVRDIGGTTAAEVWAGPALVTAFRTHTGHTDRALEFAHDVLATALRDLVDRAATSSGFTPWDPQHPDTDL